MTDDITTVRQAVHDLKIGVIRWIVFVNIIQTALIGALLIVTSLRP